MPRFSANLGFLWPDRPLLDRINAAAAAGFKAVELHYPYAVPAGDVAAACARGNLALLGINTDVGSGDDPHVGLAAVPGREGDYAALFDQALAYAVAAGGTAVHAMAGRVPEGERSAAREVFIGNLRQSAEKAAPHGLMILLEPLNPFDMPGYFYSRAEEAASIIAEVGAPNVRLMFDAYHVGRVGDDVFGLLDRFLPVIGHIQVAAVPSRAEPDEGTLDYISFFRRVDEIDYAGWVGCEYKPRGGTDEGLAWMPRLNVAP